MERFRGYLSEVIVAVVCSPNVLERIDPEVRRSVCAILRKRVRLESEIDYQNGKRSERMKFTRFGQIPI